MSLVAADLTSFFEFTSHILTAGVAITALSLLFYAFTFNLRDRVARLFAAILLCVLLVFGTEGLASLSTSPYLIEALLRVQWLGLVFLPPLYLHFSQVLLGVTGKAARKSDRLSLILGYGIALIFCALIPSPWFLGTFVASQPPAAHFDATTLTQGFTAFYSLAMVLAWLNLGQAYTRATTTSSRRRMQYLFLGSLAPALGCFPYLIFGSGFASAHTLIFWTLASISGLFTLGLLIIMAYAVAFFGVAWPDRVVKSRLFKWLMRGPVTAGLALALSTLANRLGESLGGGFEVLGPMVTVATILLCEHTITVLGPLGRRVLFYGDDRDELELVEGLEDRLVTRQDLAQFMEMILAAVTDRLQAPGAYLAALAADSFELVMSTGRVQVEKLGDQGLAPRVLESLDGQEALDWQGDLIIPLHNGQDGGPSELIGFLGVCSVDEAKLSTEERHALALLAQRAEMALHDRRVLERAFASLEQLSPQMELIQELRAAGRYDREGVLAESVRLDQLDLTQWVKEALDHYWGGPKLSESPLRDLRIVQEAAAEHGGNTLNGLRAVLNAAIEELRPEGERKYTSEWIIYNLLQMKFIEGKKVRDVAGRLAVSEADFYRKQRVALDEVAKVIRRMEVEAVAVGDRPLGDDRDR
jgi:hypothetical protein